MKIVIVELALFEHTKKIGKKKQNLQQMKYYTNS